jgi:hypothetical protein
MYGIFVIIIFNNSVNWADTRLWRRHWDFLAIHLRASARARRQHRESSYRYALERWKVESLKLSFNTFINRQGPEVVMATDNPSQPEQLQEDIAKVSDLLQIQLAKT